MSKKVCVEIHLGYYKQGDDLSHCLNNSEDSVEALRMHADKLLAATYHLKKLADILSGEEDEEIEIEAGTHYIAIRCNKRLANKIVKAKLGNFPVVDE